MMGKGFCQVAVSFLMVVLCTSGARAATGGPLDPIGWVPDVGQAKDVAIDAQSGLAYVASIQFGLSVVDVTNPARPVVVSTADTAFYAEHVAVDGPLAVVLSGTFGLTVFDVTNPRLQPPTSVAHLPGAFRAVALAGSTAYVMQGMAGNPPTWWLIVLDLTHPATPSITGRVQEGAGSLAGLRVIGSLVFVAAGNNGLEVVDVSNPAAPTIIGRAVLGATADDVDVVNGYAYVAASSSLGIVDVHNPSQPRLVSSDPILATTLAAANNSLYVIAGDSFQTLDITSPTAPRLVSTSNSFGSQGIGVLGNNVYLASPTVNPPTSQGGLYVLDL
jgi:hypothetical protein